MPTSPVQRSTSLRYLTRDLTRESKFRALQNVPQTELMLGMRPVAALAAWLSKFEPTLTSEPTLNIAVVGAEQEDTLDEGRWYGLLGYLVGNENLRARFTFVGPSLYHFSGTQPVPTPDGVWRTEGAKTLASLGYEKATVHRMDAKAYSQLPEASELDLVVMFNPGLEDDGSYSWFEAGQLAGICGLGKPIALTAYAEEEYLHEEYLLRAWGFTALEDCVRNPFIGFDTPAGTWSRHLWALKPLAPETDGKPDREMLARHERYMRIAESVIQDTAMPIPEVTGKLLPITVKGANPGQDTQGIGLPHGPGEDEMAVGLASGTLYALHKGVATPISEFSEHPVPHSILAEYDTSQKFRFEHILWAVDTANWFSQRVSETREKSFGDFLGVDVATMRQHADALKSDRDMMAIPGADQLSDLLGGFADVFGEFPSETQAMLAKGSTGFPKRGAFQATKGAESFFHALDTNNWPRASELLHERPELAQALDNKGANAAMYAASANNVAFLQELSNAGTDFGIQDEELFAPLHEAARRGHIEAATFLLDNGAPSDPTTRYSFTPLHMTLNGRMGNRPAEDFSAIVLALLAHGADAGKKNLAGIGVEHMIGEVKLTDAARKALKESLRVPKRNGVPAATS